jgi:hypothetical protein
MQQECRRANNGVVLGSFRRVIAKSACEFAMNLSTTLRVSAMTARLLRGQDYTHSEVVSERRAARPVNMAFFSADTKGRLSRLTSTPRTC